MGVLHRLSSWSLMAFRWLRSFWADITKCSAPNLPLCSLLFAGVCVGPSLGLQGATGDTGLAPGSGLVSLDLTQFLHVPAISETAVLHRVAAGRAGEGWFPGSQAGLGCLWVRATTPLFLL